MNLETKYLSKMVTLNVPLQQVNYHEGQQLLQHVLSYASIYILFLQLLQTQLSFIHLSLYNALSLIK